MYQRREMIYFGDVYQKLSNMRQNSLEDGLNQFCSTMDRNSNLNEIFGYQKFEE